MRNSLTRSLAELNPAEGIACLSAITALSSLVVEIIQMLLDLELISAGATVHPDPVPPTLVVSSVAGLVTMTMGFLIVKANAASSDSSHTRAGTCLFFIGLSVTFVATVIISIL